MKALSQIWSSVLTGLLSLIFVSIMLWTISTGVEGRIWSGTKYIDQLINARLKEEDIKPSKNSSDAEFLRRLHLDLTGQIPTVESVVSFLEDGYRNKREKKIDELIGSELYLDYWTQLWTNWLIGRDDNDREQRAGLERWIRQSLTQNMPYNQFVTALIAAEGSVEENGATNYLLRYDLSPVDLPLTPHGCSLDYRCSAPNVTTTKLRHGIRRTSTGWRPFLPTLASKNSRKG